MHLSTREGAKRLCSTRNSVAQKEGQNFSHLALFAGVSHGRIGNLAKDPLDTYLLYPLD